MFEQFKNICKKIAGSRLTVVVIAFCVMFAILIHRVFILQIVNGQETLENYKLKIQKTRYTEGTRGNILDVNGNVLAYNKLAYTVTIEDNGSYSNEKERNQVLNDTILKVIQMVEKNGDTVVNDFGIVINANDTYEFTAAEGTSRLRFLADVYGYPKIDELSEKERTSSPDDVIDFLCNGSKKKGVAGYGINQEDYDRQTILKLVNIRYAIGLNSYQKYIPVVIASDVNENTVAEIMEHMDALQGVNISEDSIRYYNDSKYFASLIGYTGKISTEEYDRLTADEKNKKKYSKTDTIGKAGLEQSMDAVLKGTKGEDTIYVDSVGKILETVKGTEAKAGNNLYLSIDKNLQIAAYKLIEEKIAGILLAKMQNVMEYTPDPEGNTKNIIIPIGDVYCALLENEVLDLDHLKLESAKENEKTIYASFSSNLGTVIEKVMAQLSNPEAAAYKELDKEMQNYLNYLDITILRRNTGILNTGAIDTNDETYKAWTEDETISFYDYLNYAISKNWIDTSKLQKYLPEKSNYSDVTETYQALLAFLKEYIQTDSGFEKLVYRYLVRNGTISGTKLCLALYEQGVLNYDETSFQSLASGSITAYDFMRSKIQNLEITPGQLALEPCTGSMVVTDVKTGKVLACVSYPGYDNNRLANSMDSSYFAKLNTDMSRPLYNSATQEKTAPGSTYKMLTTVAGIGEGVIDNGSYLGCSGEYTKIKPSPKCWIYPGGAHGTLGITEALDVSCNSFYYEVGYRLGVTDENYSSETGTQALAKYADAFGLSSTSGLEIPESEPQVSDSDSVRSAIGQGTNNYTVSQLARYVTAVANRGNVFDLSLLRHVEDTKGKTIETYEPKLKNTMDDVSSATWDSVQNGMVSMVSHSSTFVPIRNSDFSMAGKTGTAQQSKVHPDHALFVGYAPAEEPQIAVATRIANGYSSSYAAELGRDIVRYKYELAEETELIKGTAGEIGEAIAGD